jgi:membrane protein DedA with SNARE-associated domain
MSFKKGINDFLKDINFLIVFLLLIITYIFGVGITFIFSRIFGKHFLETSKKNNYWSDLNLKEKTMEEYYKQF